MPDKSIECEDCKQPFVWTEGEQEFFMKKGFQTPKRCAGCREKRAQKRERKQNDRREQRGGR
jgi:N-acetylglutamate synthase-like GNAT family acetyltransferase